MTHYTESYANLSMEEADAKAMKDIADFRGQEWVDKMTVKFREGPQYKIGEFRMALSFGGIQGYPCYAWFRKIWPEASTEEKE